MTKPNEVTREEMLDFLGRWKHCSQADQCPPEEMKKCIEVEDALRRLIEKQGEWQGTAKDLLDVRRNPNDAFRYIQESGKLLFQIRDFGKGKKR
jgi:hypothetical protein